MWISVHNNKNHLYISNFLFDQIMHIMNRVNILKNLYVNSVFPYFSRLCMVFKFEIFLFLY